MSIIIKYIVVFINSVYLFFNMTSYFLQNLLPVFVIYHQKIVSKSHIFNECLLLVNSAKDSLILLMYKYSFER